MDDQRDYVEEAANRALMHEEEETYKPLRLHSFYLNRAFDSIEDIAGTMDIKVRDVEYDTMVGIGLSGSLVIPSLARLMGKYWAIVRKQDNSHSSNKFEGTLGRRWLFVDDFVESGTTLLTCKKVIADICEIKEHVTQYVGTYQYQYGKLSERPFAGE